MFQTHLHTETGSTQAQTSNKPRDIADYKRQQRRERKSALKPGDAFPCGPNLFAEFSLVPVALDRSNILAPRETKVWGFIYRWLQTTGEAFPGYDRIAENVGVSRRQAIRLVKSLERKGFLRIAARWIDGRQTSNQYHLLWHEIFAKDDPDMNLENADFRGAPPRDSAKSTHFATNVTPEGVVHVTPEGDPDVTLYTEVLNEKKEKEQLASSPQTSKKETEPAAKEIPQQPVVAKVPENPQPERKQQPPKEGNPLIPAVRSMTENAGLHYVGSSPLSNRTAANIAAAFANVPEDDLPGAVSHFTSACQQLSRSNRARSWGLVVLLAKDAVTLARAGVVAHSCRPRRSCPPPFSAADLHSHLMKPAGALRNISAGRPQLWNAIYSLENMAAAAATKMENLEDLERSLCVLEDEIVTTLRAEQTAEDTVAIQAALEKELQPYRDKMADEQLAQIKRRYLDTAVLERARVPRLSLFYLH